MKDITLNKLWKVIMITMLIVFFPYMFNVISNGLRTKYDIILPLCFNLEVWYDTLSVGLPAALTYVIIWQSEKQQEQNDATQQRMEKLNQQMFDLEIKSKKGYFIPKIYFDEYKNFYHHRWEKGIVLINEGDDIAFIQETELYANGIMVKKEDSVNACFLNKGPFSEAVIETPFPKEGQIDYYSRFVEKSHGHFIDCRYIFPSNTEKVLARLTIYPHLSVNFIPKEAIQNIIKESNIFIHSDVEGIRKIAETNARTIKDVDLSNE